MFKTLEIGNSNKISFKVILCVNIKLLKTEKSRLYKIIKLLKEVGVSIQDSEKFITSILHMTQMHTYETEMSFKGSYKIYEKLLQKHKSVQFLLLLQLPMFYLTIKY